jgi:hypothetical protein
VIVFFEIVPSISFPCRQIFIKKTAYSSLSSSPMSESSSIARFNSKLWGSFASRGSNLGIPKRLAKVVTLLIPIKEKITTTLKPARNGFND